ncbi:MAG TPA: TRAP transporter small permease [Pseudomonadota bacterium]|nr:TRAP transporter small permease [Rhodanobacteraceae bacterium]MBP9153679.1 TRAP transporter small permease [Xanthomonadales bacterium]HQW82694.1 TRAP transporter small permease [Pseudomonadota bacterium]
MKAGIGRALGVVNTLENWLIAALALALMLLAGVQIVLRLLDHGLIWLDPLLRVLVIWVALLGAVAAARSDKHISLDVVGKLLHGKALRVARVFAFGFASVMSLVMLRASLGLIELDRESATTLFGSVPAWWAELILPIAFTLLSLRFALRAFAVPVREDRVA